MFFGNSVHNAEYIPWRKLALCDKACNCTMWLKDSKHRHQKIFISYIFVILIALLFVNNMQKSQEKKKIQKEKLFGSMVECFYPKYLDTFYRLIAQLNKKNGSGTSSYFWRLFTHPSQGRVISKSEIKQIKNKIIKKCTIHIFYHFFSQQMITKKHTHIKVNTIIFFFLKNKLNIMQQ